jgi:hypothetical protein
MSQIQSQRRIDRMHALVDTIREAALAGQPCPTDNALGEVLQVTIQTVTTLFRAALAAGLIQRESHGGWCRVVIAPDGSWRTTLPATSPRKKGAPRRITDESVLAVVDALKSFANAPCPTDAEIGAIVGMSRGVVEERRHRAVSAGLLVYRLGRRRAPTASAPDKSWTTLPGSKLGAALQKRMSASTGVQVVMAGGAALADPRNARNAAFLHAQRIQAAPALSAEQEQDAISRFLAVRGPTLCPARCCAAVNNGRGL